jgi:hypothetical protein
MRSSAHDGVKFRATFLHPRSFLDFWQGLFSSSTWALCSNRKSATCCELGSVLNIPWSRGPRALDIFLWVAMGRPRVGVAINGRL